MLYPSPLLAFIGSSIGYTEMGLLLFVALLLFGPKKIPEIARSIGRVMEELRRASNEFKSQVMSISEETEEATRVIQDDLSIPRTSSSESDADTHSPSPESTDEEEYQSMNPYEMDEYQRRLHQDQTENTATEATPSDVSEDASDTTPTPGDSASDKTVPAVASNGSPPPEV